MQTVAFKEIAWEDRTSSVKIMLFCDGVGSPPKEDIAVQFEPSSVVVEVRNLRGVTYRFARELKADIVPAKSKWTLSSNRVNLIVAKEKAEPWSSFERQKEPRMPKLDKNEDPNVGLMKMMKQMYDEGDDDMKRTIAQAYTEANEKKMKDMN